MPLVINNNIPSLDTQRNISKTNNANAKTLERLSSGLRINRAGDDAAGLAISEKLRAQVRGLDQAVRNANDGISLVGTTEGALNTITNIVQRLRELAVQASSDTNTSADRATIVQEATQLTAEITRIGNTTEFNGKALLNGSFTSGKIQIGANYNQSISFSIGDVRAAALGKRTSITGTLSDGAANGNDAGITPGEVTINGTRVVTTSGDDQVSVLDIVGSTAASVGSIADGGFQINGVNLGAISTFGTAASTAAGIVSVISNNTSLSTLHITARVVAGSQVALEATHGTDLVLRASGMTVSSLAGITGINSAFFGSATDVTTVNGQSSAMAKAAAVNAVKSDTNVSASAQTTTVTGSSAVTAGSLSDGDLYINGVNIGAVTFTASDGSGTLVAAINAQTSSTGVVASVNTDNKLVLTATDGRNISVIANGGASTYANLSTTVQRADLQLDSTDAITIAGSNYTELGSNITATTYQPDLNNVVADIDLSTQSGADSAILSLDAALAQLNNQRSQLGALQNRLELTVDNLSTTSENLSASESRIRDADFAAETAKMTRNQILLQAGTAILAQANTLPQLALQLLR